MRVVCQSILLGDAGKTGVCDDVSCNVVEDFACIYQASQQRALCCVQTLLGEGAQVVLEGQRVLPAKTQEQGFNFKYDDVDSAVREIVSN